MSTFNPIKRLGAIVLSMSIALPVQTWARDVDAEKSMRVESEGATEGAPFFYQEFDTPQGRAFTVIAAFPQDAERDVVSRLAANTPKGFTLAFNDIEDPGFQAAMASGNLEWINSYKMGSIDQAAPIRASGDASRTQKLLAKFKQMGLNVKNNPVGLIAAFGYAGVVSTGGVYVQTSSVTATLGAIVPVGLLAAFSATQSTDYGKYVKFMGKSGVKLIDAVATAFGSKLNAANRQIIRAGGMFVATMASGWTSSGIIMTLGHQDFTLMSLTTMAIATNIGVWDATVGRLVAQGKLDHKWEPRYFIFGLAASTLGELGTLLHVPHVEATMGVTAVMGLSYLMAGNYIENNFGRAKNAVTTKIADAKGRVVAGVNNASLKTRLAAARAARATATSCDALLGKAGAAIGLPAANAMVARVKSRVFSRQANSSVDGN